MLFHLLKMDEDNFTYSDFLQKLNKNQKISYSVAEGEL